MITRSEYMSGDHLGAAGQSKHRAYYGDIIAAMGGHKAIQLPFSIEKVRAALEAGDTHLNTLPLGQWDNHVRYLTRSTAALKERGDYLTLGTGVCILKEAARLRAEEA